MGKYIHKFNTVSEFNDYRNENYKQPWLSYTVENDNVDYNCYTPEEYAFLSVPFTIESLGTGTITWTLGDKTVEYSKNSGEWTTMDKDTTISVVEGDEIQFIGENENYYENRIISTANYNAKGNIMSLIAGEDFISATTLEENAFRNGIFDNGADPGLSEFGVVSAEYLILPVTTLSPDCYFSLFRRCYNLITPPKLPATVLAEHCYHSMFMHCTSLKEAPELIATTLAPNCYMQMFQNTRVAIAPKLPAKNLEQFCYAYMFQNCTSLIKAPELNATVLADNCYQAMFYGCTNLKTAPYLPATNLFAKCYSYMFRGCSSLELPEDFVLPARVLTEQCYMAMFHSAQFTHVPENMISATTLATECYWGMFQYCSNLITAPKLLSDTLVEGCYKGLFLGCTSLQHIECLATDISATDCLAEWVKDVSPTGTFIKASNDVQWQTGKNGIPEGWTVEITTE